MYALSSNRAILVVIGQPWEIINQIIKAVAVFDRIMDSLSV